MSDRNIQICWISVKYEYFKGNKKSGFILLVWILADK